MYSANERAVLSNLQRQVSALSARLDAREAQNDNAERTRLLATRPDLPPELRRTLATAPLRTVRDVVNVPAGAFGGGGGGGALLGERGVMSSPEVKASIDQRMGIVPSDARPRRQGNRVLFPVMTPEQARAKIAASRASR